MTWRLDCGSGKSHAFFYLEREARHAYHRLDELTLYESVKGLTQILSDDMNDTGHAVLRNLMAMQKDKF